jgi:hypothetical protein
MHTKKFQRVHLVAQKLMVSGRFRSPAATIRPPKKRESSDPLPGRFRWIPGGNEEDALTIAPRISESQVFGARK